MCVHVFVRACVSVKVKEYDTGTSPHQEQSAAGQAEPKVPSTGGVIKALRMAHRGMKGQRGELITHNLEEELSPNPALKTNTLTHTNFLKTALKIKLVVSPLNRVNMI